MIRGRRDRRRRRKDDNLAMDSVDCTAIIEGGTIIMVIFTPGGFRENITPCFGVME